MTVEKWKEKAGKILESIKSEKLIACNDEYGAYFADCGFYAYAIPGERIYTCNVGALEKGKNLYKYFQIPAQLAHVEKGELVSDHEIIKGRLLKNDACAAMINEKYARKFPANSLFYITGPNKPVIVGLWEDQLYIIGLIMPVIRHEFKKGE